MSAERTKRPTVELRAALSIGHSSQQDPDNYNLIFGDWVGAASEEIRQKNAQALGDLLRRAPQVNQGLTLVRSTRETTEVHREGSIAISEAKRDLYEARFEGSFKVPWRVKATVVNGQIVVDYQAHLTRPDLSLEYLLKQSMRPEFHYPMYYGGRKSRTRIDGLLVWLRINDWEIANTAPPRAIPATPRVEDIPSSLSLTRKGLKAVTFARKEGKGASLAHTDRFIGRWHERWFLNEVDGQKEVSRVEVRLRGSWEDNLQVAR